MTHTTSATPSLFAIADDPDQTAGRGTLLTDAASGRLALATVTEMASTSDPRLVCDLLCEAAAQPAAVLALAVLAVRLSLAADRTTPPLASVQRLAMEHEMSLFRAS